MRTKEAEIRPSGLELYDIELTPTDEPVRNFRWIREHPGVRVISFDGTKGITHSYLYKKVEPARYVEVRNAATELPEHIVLMEDKKTGRLVVAKDENKAMGGSYFMWTNIPDEAHKTAVEEYPYIATVYGLATKLGGKLYMIMEYLPNGDLNEWLKGLHSVKEIGEVVHKLALALNHIHKVKGMTFGDMKPRNVGFDAEWNPKVIDFELAEFVAGEEMVYGQPGTYEYAAPEQREKNRLSTRGDIYSLAATVFSILIDPIPEWDQRSTRTLFERDMGAQIPFRGEYGGKVLRRQRKALSRVLHKALAKNPEDRYASAMEFDAAFQEALQGK